MLKDKRLLAESEGLKIIWRILFTKQVWFLFYINTLPFYTNSNYTKIIPGRTLIIKQKLTSHSYESKIHILWLFYQKPIHFCLKLRFKELTYHLKTHLNLVRITGYKMLKQNLFALPTAITNSEILMF